MKARAGIVFFLLIIIYLNVNLTFYTGDSIKPPQLLTPLLWLGMALITWAFPQPRAAGRLRLRGMLNILALICAGLYLTAMAAGGFMEGFGRSPYAFTPRALLSNFFLAASSILGMEMARAYLLNVLSTRRSHLLIVIISIGFLVLEITISKLAGFKTLQQAVNYAGTTILPGLSENLLVSYFAYLGGPLPAIVYKAVVQGFYWFSPVLPNPGWVVKTLLGSIVPFGCLLLVQYLYHWEARELEKSPSKKESTGEWLTVSVISILIIWFAVGLFPIYPSVIATGSMEPLIKPGDVIILKKASKEVIKPGDVIHFWKDNIYITHRVVGLPEPGAKVYTTKGDNNDAIDSEPVSHQQVKGKLMYVIPKLGWPSLILRSQGSAEL